MNFNTQKCFKCKKYKELSNFRGLTDKPVASCKECRKDDYINKEYCIDCKHWNLSNTFYNLRNYPLLCLKCNVRKERKKLEDYALSKQIKCKLLNNNIDTLIFCCQCYFCYEYGGDTLKIIRLNENECYNKNNCIACCKICFSIKQKLDLKTFVNRCMHITQFHKDGKILYNEVWIPYINKSYLESKSYYENYMDFKLTKKEFKKIVEKPCKYCNAINTSQHQNGIICIKDIFYSCCFECDKMQDDIFDDDFILHCNKIANNINNIKIPDDIERCYIA